jgi:hypothetical protein
MVETSKVTDNKDIPNRSERWGDEVIIHSGRITTREYKQKSELNKRIKTGYLSEKSVQVSRIASITRITVEIVQI